MAGGILFGYSAGDPIRLGANVWRTIVHGKFKFILWLDYLHTILRKWPARAR